MTTQEKALFLHKEWNGKINTTPKCHVNSREDLAIAYTPGVAEPCKVIAQDKAQAYQYTIKANTAGLNITWFLELKGTKIVILGDYILRT